MRRVKQHERPGDRRHYRNARCRRPWVALGALLMLSSFPAHAFQTGQSSLNMLNMEPGSCNGVMCHGLASSEVFVSIDALWGVKTLTADMAARLEI